MSLSQLHIEDIKKALNNKNLHLAILTFIEFGEYLQLEYPGQKFADLHDAVIKNSQYKINEAADILTIISIIKEAHDKLYYKSNLDLDDPIELENEDFLAIGKLNVVNTAAVLNIDALKADAYYKTQETLTRNTLAALKKGYSYYISMGKAGAENFNSNSDVKDVDKSIKQAQIFIEQDVIPNTPARLKLNAKITKIENLDDNLKETAEELRDISRTYFSQPIKTWRAYDQFHQDCKNQLEKADNLIKENKRATFAMYAKDIALIIAGIATLGVALIARAVYTKVNTGKISLFFDRKGHKEIMKCEKTVASIASSIEDEQDITSNEKVDLIYGSLPTARKF